MSNKKEDKIPNSLIIYIKTKIPNFYKLNYEPYMTVPKNTSRTVYLDPLIKYYEGPIKNIPSQAPENTLYTQFFEESEFDTMINRILSRYMQKPRTFQEAYDERFIDNNIEITLNTLFKDNNLFYINNKPYTIVGSKWDAGNWQIDKKPLDKLLTQFSHLTPKQLEKQIKEEEKNIPEIIRQGTLASSNLSKEESTSAVINDLQNASNNSPPTQIQPLESFINKEQLPGVPEYLKRLCTEFLKKNIPINYSDVADLSRDPITLSLLIDPSELLKYINKNKDTKIIELYSAFINAKSALQIADQEYINIFTELTKYQNEFNKSMKDIWSNFLRNYFKKEVMPKIEKVKYNIRKKTLLKNENISTIQEIILLKTNYIQLIFKIADAIMQIYVLQNTYFISTKLLLEELKKEYVNIIKYYEEPVLALKCIEYDIATIQLLIEEDPENNYSKSYFSNYNDFKKFYERTLYDNKDMLLNPQINYAEEFNVYKNNPSTLLIEIHQYELYNFKMFLFYSFNQFNIWIVLFKTIQEFTNVISNISRDIMNNYQQQIDNYDSKFSKDEQEKFLNRISASGVKASYNKVNKKFSWYLVKEDGTRCLNQTTNKKTLRLMEDEMHERLYIKTIQSQVKSYDAIILYIYLLEINCLRRNKLNIAEQNIEYLNLEYSVTLGKYYNVIKNNLNTNPNMLIPESLLWNTVDLNNDIILEQRIISNKKMSIVYRKRIKVLRKSRHKLEKFCENISDIITPTISENGFINKCKTLIETNTNDISEYSFKSNFWLQKSITNYDITNTNDFIYNINQVVEDAWYDRIINTREPEDYLDWVVYNNSGTNTEDSIYAAVCDGLNGQMDLDGAETNNKYTELVDGKKIFTINSLKQLVSENNNQNEINTDIILQLLQEVLKIKFIIFDMIPKQTEQIYLRDIVNYRGAKYRVINIDSNSLVTLYDGYSVIEHVPYNDIEKSNSNLFYFFNVSYLKLNNLIEFEDYLYLVTSYKTNDNQFIKYELVRNSNFNNYIFTFNNIPKYIKYLIYNNCIRQYYVETNNNVSDFSIFGLKEFIPDFNKFTTKIQKNTVNELNEELNEELHQIVLDIMFMENKLEELKNTDETDDDKQKQLQIETLLEDIDLLKQKKIRVEDKLKQSTFAGGDIAQKPSEQYEINNSNNYPKQIKYPINTNSNIIYYPRRIQERKKKQNNSKDTKSKFSFYITIELELFPGKTANVLQKSEVKCQHNFERIREAYAEIFGLQYRPSPMASAYAYNKTNKDKDNDEDNDEDNKSKTVKNKNKNKTVKTDKNKTVKTDKNKTVKNKTTPENEEKISQKIMNINPGPFTDNIKNFFPV